MDFSKEPYVKIYTTSSPTGILWGFFGRVLMNELVRVADRAGVIVLPPELRGDLAAGIASVIGCSNTSWVREWLPKIMEHGAVRHVAQTADDGAAADDTTADVFEYLVITRYHEAQYNSVTKTLSNTMSERKRKDTQRAIDLGLIEPPFWLNGRREKGNT